MMEVNISKHGLSFLKKPDQTMDQYIMAYDDYKTKLEKYSMKLPERIHALNILSSSCLNDSELRIAVREVDLEKPDEMHKQAKSALKKYFGIYAINGKSGLIWIQINN